MASAVIMAIWVVEFQFGDICFVHPVFRFWFFDTFGDKVTKIYVIFVYILKGKMGKTEKNPKENHATEVTKIPKTKRRKYGMKETIEFGKFLPKSKQIQRKI